MQVVDQVYDEEAAKAMLLKNGTVCIMIHTGSRGLGHQVCLPMPLTGALPLHSVKTLAVFEYVNHVACSYAQACLDKGS